MRLSPANFTSYAVFVLVLVGLGVLGVIAIDLVFGWLNYSRPLWVEIPGSLAIAGVLFSLFDKYFWSWGIFRRLGIIDFPDLRGRWTGELVSSYEDGEKTTSAALEIRQSASSTVISLYTEQSRSTSTVVTHGKAGDEQDAITYAYRNQRKALSPDTMQSHFGSADLRYYPDIQELRGEYFTSGERRTHGTLKFSFDRKRLLGRFE